MNWDKGKGAIDSLVAAHRLQRVTPSTTTARALVDEARRHLSSADRIADDDPQGAYALAYDAARKAMAAVFEAQGLRATSAGGHVVLFDAAEAQFDPPLGHLFRPFNRMRVRRNQIEYASTENLRVTPDEVRADVEKARRLIDDFALVVIERVLPGREP